MLKTSQMKKLEHMILHLKSIALQNNYPPKLLNLHHKNNLCLLNLKTQITKPAYKKYCSYCHRANHSISACFKKQRDDEDKRDAYARSKSPQKSFVQYFRSPSNDKTKHYDNRYRSQGTSRNNC